MIMAIDQYGQAYHDLGKYPRKELLHRFTAKKADRMYVTRIGYVIRGTWLALYNVEPWSKPA